MTFAEWERQSTRKETNTSEEVGNWSRAVKQRNQFLGIGIFCRSLLFSFNWKNISSYKLRIALYTHRALVTFMTSPYRRVPFSQILFEYIRNTDGTKRKLSNLLSLNRNCRQHYTYYKRVHLLLPKMLFIHLSNLVIVDFASKECRR